MTRPAVVVLHGLWMGRWQMATLAARLQRAGFAAHRYGYPSIRGDWETQLQALRTWALALQAPVLHWVGHSLGGVLIVHLLHRFQHELPPGRAVCLGSPLAGSEVARRLARRRWTRWALGQSALPLVQAAPPIPEQRAIASIAGTRRLGAALLTGGLTPPHDGTVRVEETQVAGLAAHANVAASHTTLAWNRQASELTAAFLHGQPWPDVVACP